LAWDVLGAEETGWVWLVRDRRRVVIMVARTRGLVRDLGGVN